MDFRLLNGKPKCTLIQKFNHLVVVIDPEGHKITFNCLNAAQKFILHSRWEVNVFHIHPGHPEE